MATKIAKKKNRNLSVSALTLRHRVILAVYALFFLAGATCFSLPYASDYLYIKGLYHEINGDNASMRKQVHLALRGYLKAVDYYQTAITLSPWEKYYRNKLGQAYTKMGNVRTDIGEKVRYYHKAESTYLKAIQLDDKNPWMITTLAEVYEVLAKLVPNRSNELLQKAVKRKLEVVQLDRNNPLFKIFLANFYYQFRDFKNAIPYYQEAMRLDASLPEAPYKLANMYFQMNRQQEAYQLYQNVYKQDRGYKDIRLALSQVYYQNGDSNTAIRLLTEEIYQKPFKIYVLQKLIQIFKDTGQGDQIDTVCRNLIARTSSNRNKGHRSFSPSYVNQIRQVCQQ